MRLLPTLLLDLTARKPPLRPHRPSPPHDQYGPFGNRPPPVLGLLLTMVDRDPDESIVLSRVRDHYGEEVFAPEIRTDPALLLTRFVPAAA